MLISLLILLLTSNALTLRGDKSILFCRTAIIGLVFTVILSISSLFVTPLSKGIGVYGGLYNITTLSHTFNIFILLVSVLILGLTSFFPRKHNFNNFSFIPGIYSLKLHRTRKVIANNTSEAFRIIEYALIIIFVLCGAMFLISTADLVSIFLSIELQSYGLYILSTLYRNSELSTRSGLTYFLLGGLSSCFILLGSAFLYINSGTTNLENIYIMTSISLSDSSFVTETGQYHEYGSYYIYLSLIIMSVGFLFKVSAAPFHFWAPDVYDGIPTIVTTFVAIVPKISIFAFLLELVYYTEHAFSHALSSSMYPQTNNSSYGINTLIEAVGESEMPWKNVLLISSLFSLVVGSVLGLTQFRIKRLFAYSTISHVGFILLALSINTAEAVQAYIFYLLQYSISNLNAFLLLVGIGFSFYLYNYDNTAREKESGEELVDQNNSPVQLISQITGYFYLNPFLAISLSITLFSFIGIPPLIGFFAKQMILSAALDSGYVFMALVAIITSVIGAGYYLNLIKQIFFNPPKVISVLDRSLPSSNEGKNFIAHIKAKNVSINGFLANAISILTLLLLLFIHTPTQWFNMVNILSIMLFKG